MEKNQILDTHYFCSYVGNEPEQQRMMINLFIKQADSCLLGLIKAHQDNDDDTWHALSHKLKGMASFSGAMILYNTCQHAEKHSHSDQQDKNKMLSQIIQDIADTKSAFCRFLKQGE